MDWQCRESEGKAKIEGYMSISDEEAHHRINPLSIILGWDDPWNILWSLCSLWDSQCYLSSGVILSWNVSSMIVPRCLSSLLLMLSEDRSSKLCTDSGILEWVSDGPGTGRGLFSLSSPLLSDVL